MSTNRKGLFKVRQKAFVLGLTLLGAFGSQTAFSAPPGGGPGFGGPDGPWHGSGGAGDWLAPLGAGIIHALTNPGPAAPAAAPAEPYPLPPSYAPRYYGPPGPGPVHPFPVFLPPPY